MTSPELEYQSFRSRYQRIIFMKEMKLWI